MTTTPQISLGPLIGVCVAICGNILISIALNTQKWAHNKLSSPVLVQHEELVWEDELQPGPSDLLLDREAGQIPPDNDLDSFDTHSHAPQSAIERPSYLTSKVWWFGLVLMILGEVGNFIAYGFAPAILVAPLGTVALISNILIAPFFLGERMRTQDFFGIGASCLGTFIILAVSSSTNEPTLGIEELYRALMQPAFILYVIVTFSVLLILLRCSSTDMGRKFILIDLLIAGLIGGYTVLSIKALSSLLKLDIYLTFTHWITYVMISVLLITGVFQIHFLNKSLSNFNSVEVVPTNFVIFTTCSIIASSIMYNDLSRTSPFSLMGVFFMFLGVIMITSRTSSGEYQRIQNQDELILDPPNQLHSPLFSATAEAIQIPINDSGRRSNGDAKASLRRLSGVFLSTISASVGTSAVLRLSDLVLSAEQQHQ